MEKANSGIIRTSFGLQSSIKPQLEESYSSGLVEQIRANGFRRHEGRVELFLAEEFGFCYGVDRAIDYAYQTRAQFPDRRIFLTNEIIHNPRVNAELKQMGIDFLPPLAHGSCDLSGLNARDVVLMPAFGTTVDLQKKMEAIGCVIVDTTCGSVMSVWKRVESYSRDGFTSIIHGKYNHEETLATSSRALKYPGGKYLVVRDKEQAQKVCEYIEERGDRALFLKEFAACASEGFDPEHDLRKIGCANQTTMLSSESLEIANMLKDSIAKRFGEESLPERFRHFDTICSATQDRQDAVMRLLQKKPDLMLVVGGYNSSNTGHLAEMSAEHCSAYHVKDAACLKSADEIEYKVIFRDDIRIARGWLPSGAIKVGITAGASTPNKVIEEVIVRLFSLANEVSV
jgi:4-hydroxy-3-methylbut-2-enyl diphosphate reductase